MNNILYGEFAFYGVYMPGVLALMSAAYVVKTMIRAVLACTGFYGWVWHPALFNAGVYVLALAAVTAAAGGGHG